MGLATNSGLSTYTLSASEFLDLSNELAEIIRRDNTALLQRVPMAGEATETTHSWIEDSLNPNTASDSGSGINNSATTLNVVAGQGVRFKVGSLIRDTAAGVAGLEVMQVTAIATDALTIVRGYGGTTAQAHAASFVIQIFANPNQEGQDPPSDESKVRPKVSNFTQIFQKGINVSATMRSVLQAGVADEFTFQIARRLMEIMRELDSSIVAGIKSASAGSASAYRSMGGLVGFVNQAGGNIRSTAEALTPSVLNDMCNDIWSDGGVPNFVLVGGKQKRAISGFDQAYRRSQFDTTTAGYFVDKFISDMGFILDVIVDPWMLDDHAIVGDMNRLRCVPLRGSAMRAEDLAKTGASNKAQVYGEYTVEVRNAKEAFAIHYGLT